MLTCLNANTLQQVHEGMQPSGTVAGTLCQGLECRATPLWGPAQFRCFKVLFCVGVLDSRFPWCANDLALATGLGPHLRTGGIVLLVPLLPLMHGLNKCNMLYSTCSPAQPYGHIL